MVPIREGSGAKEIKPPKPMFLLRKGRSSLSHARSFRKFTASMRNDRKRLNSTPLYHGVFKYLHTLLITIVPVKYQGKAIGPFDTHPKNMFALVIVICIYYLMLLINKEEMNRTKHRGIAHRYFCSVMRIVILILGTLSSLLLVSILLPESLAALVIVIWVLLVVLHVRKRIYRGFMKGITFVFGKFKGVMEPNKLTSLPTTF